jgi:acyl-CoA reductase-like NAD-dependent aldehyde dehydrogenase
VFEDDSEAADVDGVMREIAEAIKEEQERLARIAAAESDPI